MKHILTLAALVFATSCFGQEACPNVHDINSNGTIDIEDFLSILGLFADVDVDEDGVWDSQDDCLDATACNYLASPTEPCSYLDALGECGGACEGDGDGDGICDDVDTCVGELDECGVCNGPGPTEVVIEDITILYDSVYLPQLEEWYVYEFGADTTFSFECVPEFTCGEPVGYHGYDYETVQIGDQCWFAENLRTFFFDNDEVITSQSFVDSASWWFPNGSPLGIDEELVGAVNGLLYNLPAVSDERGLCPSGWIVPSMDEWVTLAESVGGLGVAGENLRSSLGWDAGYAGSDDSGFSAFPSGFRFPDGSFYETGDVAMWWSSTAYIDGAWQALIEGPNPGFGFSAQSYSNFGFSVRCLKDSE